MVIALSLSPLAAYGQTSASPANNAPTTSSQTIVVDDRGDCPGEHHNYGWIGLLGLLGLTGLMRKRQEDRHVDYSASWMETRRMMAGSGVANNRLTPRPLFNYESISLAWQK